MKSTRTWWLVFAACAAFVVAAMIGISVLVLRMERAGLTMRAETDRNAELRAALWDMESWLIAHLGRESSRSHDEFRSYFPADNVYTRYLSKITPGDVYAPSPLLTFDSEFFPIHFEIDPANEFTSPQVPTGNELDLAQATLLPEGWVERKNDELLRVCNLISYSDAALYCADTSAPDWGQTAQLASADTSLQQGVSSQWQQQVDEVDTELVQQARGQQEFQRRAEARDRADQVLDKSSYANVAPQIIKGGAVGVPSGVAISSFTPVWIDTGGPEGPGVELMFLREVTVGDDPIYQGFLCHWPRMRTALIEQVSDRFPDVQIVPVSLERGSDPITSANMFRLASIPAVIESDALANVSPGLVTPARATLAVAWLFVLLAIWAAGLTLRSTIDFARRRTRFASAVTHELRTPLTTFRMYSEMLADGMVSDPAQRQVYYDTLHEESTRLSGIVENVLAYAQIEEGRPRNQIERIRVGELLDRFRPAWDRRAAKCAADVSVDCTSSDDAIVTLDIESFDQIMTNLIDNACKYGRCNDAQETSAPHLIHVSGGVLDSNLRVEVRDNGPGIDSAVEDEIFRPFERGLIEPGSATAGVGLGLAISRELAMRMGGSLTHCRPACERGACFVLTLPVD